MKRPFSNRNKNSAHTIVGALLLAGSSLLIASCSSRDASSPQSSTSAAAKPSTQTTQNSPKGGENRVENKTLGLSYVLPDGFSESTQNIPAGFPAAQVLPKGGSIPGPAIRILKITAETSSPGFDATKSNDENIDGRVDDLTTKKAGYGLSGVKRSHWDDAGLPASAATITLSSNDGSQKVQYFYAYVGQGSDRWTIMTTDDGTGAGKFLGEEAEALAKSLRKLSS